MQDLRLVGISENGEHVLLTDGAGGRYSLALNDDLKRVVRRDKTQTLGATAQTSPQAPLRPRDVQALIRAGVPLEEIAERAGWSVEKVLRYEGPIRAERDYIGELAQSVILDSREDSVTLRDRAAKRLADRGVEAERVVWDSWKSDEDQWSVVVRFPAGGRLREATWHFDPTSRALQAIDDEARWLGGDENARAPKSVTDETPTRPAPAHTRDEPVFDVEAEGWEEESPTSKTTGRKTTTPQKAAAPQKTEHREELTSAMRERQANRRLKSTTRSSDPANITGIATPAKSDEGGVEKLDLTGDAPPFGSHPRPSEFSQTEPAVTAKDASSVRDADPSDTTSVAAVELSDASTQNNAPEDAGSDVNPSSSGRDRKRREQRRSRAQTRVTPSSDDNSSDDSLETLSGEPDEKATEDVVPVAENQVTQPDEAPADGAELDEATETPDAQVPTRPAQSRKGGRPSVPSWDDIMFGGRSKR